DENAIGKFELLSCVLVPDVGERFWVELIQRRASSHPEFSGGGIFADKKDGIVAERAVVERSVLSHLEAIAVVTVQPAVCPDPDKSVPNMVDGIDIAL